jgi:hypothetical protein
MIEDIYLQKKGVRTVMEIFRGCTVDAFFSANNFFKPPAGKKKKDMSDV